MSLVFPSKGSQTLFYTIGLYAMQLSSFLINPKHFKSRMTAHFKQVQEQQRQPAFGLHSGLGGVPTTGSTGGFAGGLKKSSPLSPSEAFMATSDIMFSEQLEFSIVDPAMI